MLDTAADAEANDITSTDVAVEPDLAELPCMTIGGIYAAEGQCSVALGSSMNVHPIVCVDQDVCAAKTWLVRGLPLTLTLDATEWWGEPTAGTCGGTATDTGFAFDCSPSGEFEPGQCVGTATHVAVSDATRFCCDLASNDCGDGQRCAVIRVDGRDGAATACVPATEAQAEGSACTVAVAPAADACGEGLVCTDTGSAGEYTCQRLCDVSSACGEGNACVALAGYGSFVDNLGVCRPACDSLAPACDGEAACVDGRVPSGALNQLIRTTHCGVAGDVLEGGLCSVEGGDCSAGLLCGGRDAVSRARCLAPCKQTSDCEEGRECVHPFTYDDPSFPALADLGLCFPAEE